jgi:hypothetical protein
MARKIYKRVGIRKDRNLGDLSNTTEALNNLLDTLVDDNSTFISEDLDALRTMSSQRLTSSAYSEVIGSRTVYSNQNGISIDYLPRITYQNKIDRFKFFAGDPFVDGGNGLTARYFDYSNVFENTLDIFSGPPLKVDNFWEAGNFTFTDKVIPESTTLNGGIEWEGTFIPTNTGSHTFYINSSACFTFDLQPATVSVGSSISTTFNVTQSSAATVNTIVLTASPYHILSFSSLNLGSLSRKIYPNVDYKITGTGGFQIFGSGSILGLDDSGGTGSKDYDYDDLSLTVNRGSFFTRNNNFYYRLDSYDEISRVGIASTLAGSGTVGSNTVGLSSTTETKYVAIGQTISGTGIATGSLVNSFNRTTGVISLTPPTGEPYSVKSSFSGNITFRKNIGDSTSISYTTPVLTEYEKYRLRFRYYIPSSIDATSVQRYINFDILYPTDSTASNFYYNKLYSLDYPFETASGQFPIFVESSILTGGGTIGGDLNSNDYIRVTSSKKVDVKYQPKISVSEITKASTTASVTFSTNIMTLTNTSNIEVGNYVFGTGITEGTTRVEEITINKNIVLSGNSTGSSSGTYTFIDHRGFVKKATGSATSGTITLTSGDTTSLTKDMVAIGSGLQAYTKVQSISGSTTLTISPSQSVGAGTTFYFYYSKGLINNGLVEFCIPAETKCMLITADTPAGSTIIPVTDSSGVGNGWSVQGFQFASGTTVNGAPTSTTSITISTPTTSNLVSGANFTVSSASGDRTLCCPPTDTSPPFNPTEEGLETTAAAPSLRLESGNLSFDSLRAVVSSSNITSYSPTNTSNSRLSIQTPSGTFKILCS